MTIFDVHRLVISIYTNYDKNCTDLHTNNAVTLLLLFFRKIMSYINCHNNSIVSLSSYSFNFIIIMVLQLLFLTYYSNSFHDLVRSRLECHASTMLYEYSNRLICHAIYIILLHHCAMVP